MAKRPKRKAADRYPGAQLDITVSVEAPLYGECLDWMGELPDSRAATLDFWARGNFVRHLLHTRQSGRHPILIPAAHPSQMDWAYRRLALAGVPVTFMYTGALAKPTMILHWQPLDLTVDAGWGYLAGAGTIVANENGRRFWPVLGCASLMPETVVEWLAVDAGAGFAAGRLFVAPTPLIGISTHMHERELDALADVADATRAWEALDTANAALDIQLPWIDRLPLADFETLLVDYNDELQEFQTAFRELASGYHGSLSEMRAARRRLEDAIRELLSSDRQARMRTIIAKAKASLTTFPLTIGALATAGAVYAKDPFAGAAVLAAAGKQLRHLWRQAKADARAALRSPYRVLLRFGLNDIAFGALEAPQPKAVEAPPEAGSLGPEHWLCPPTSGLRFLTYRK